MENYNFLFNNYFLSYLFPNLLLTISKMCYNILILIFIFIINWKRIQSFLYYLHKSNINIWLCSVDFGFNKPLFSSSL